MASVAQEVTRITAHQLVSRVEWTGWENWPSATAGYERSTTNTKLTLEVSVHLHRYLSTKWSLWCQTPSFLRAFAFLNVWTWKVTVLLVLSGIKSPWNLRVHLPKLNGTPVRSGSYHGDRGGQRKLWCKQRPVADFVWKAACHSA